MFEKDSLVPFAVDYGKLVEPFRKHMLRPVLLIFAVQLLALGEPFVISFVIDSIVRKRMFVTAHLEKLLPCAAVVLAFVGFVVVQKNKHARRLESRMKRDILVACCAKLLRLPLLFHHRENPGLVLGKVTKGIKSASELTVVLVNEILPLTVQICITVIVMAFFNWKGIIALVPVCALFFYLTVKVKMSTGEIRRQRKDRDGEIDAMLGQSVTNVAVVQAYCQEGRMTEALATLADDMDGLLEEEHGIYDRTDIGRNIVVVCGRILILYVTAKAALAGMDVLSIGLVAFIMTLSERIMLNCYRVGTMFNLVVEALDPVQRIRAILEAEVTITDPAEPAVLPERVEGRIEFDHVCFSYGDPLDPGATQADVLHDVSFTVSPGERIGIIGESGCGKSTLAMLIGRGADTRCGSVRVGGVDVRRYPLSKLRGKTVARVAQNEIAFDGTIAENIAFGRPDATIEEIEAAADIADASRFIAKLLLKYQQKIGNRGMRLSGGQLQRLGIARALLCRAPITIFDEATSNLDVETERRVLNELKARRGNETVIIITHRLATIRDADRIIVMEGGRIVDQGPPDVLQQKAGLYRRLLEIEAQEDALR